MTSLLTAIALVAVFLLAWLGLRMRAAKQRDDGNTPADNLDTVTAWTPQATRVLTNAERDAYETLRRALPSHIVLAQVPLSRFIKVPTRNSYSEWLRRVGQLCADLVICDRHSQVIAVVEIHSSKEEVNPRVLKRQQRLARVLRAAEVSVHVWPDNALPSIEAAREAIAPESSSPETEPNVASALTRTTPQRPRNGANTDRLSGEADSEAMSELQGARPSTWFDDFDSSHVPLASEQTKTTYSR